MKLSHLDAKDRPRMVDVSGKEPSLRTAVASGEIVLSGEMFLFLEKNPAPKGNVLNTAVVAGIQAAKRTSSIIPMCHPLQIESIGIDFSLAGDCLQCTCSVSATARTGFEMEALVGVTTALLTVYDMLKAVDRRMVIRDVRLVGKTGGKSGSYTESPPDVGDMPLKNTIE